MQSNSLFPKPNLNTKLVVMLLCGGLVVLVVAGYILFRQRSPAPAPPPKPKSVAYVAPTPLVTEEPSRPLQPSKEADAGSEPVPEEKSKGRGRGGGKFGTIDTKEVSRFMNARFGQVKACYERRLKTNSFLEGIMDLNIEIKPSGRVGGISVKKNTVRDAHMTTCVKRVVRGWQFPKPEGGRVIIAKKFNFQKKG